MRNNINTQEVGQVTKILEKKIVWQDWKQIEREQHHYYQ